MRTTNIRFTGLASGLDTESMVKSLVMPYKMKVDEGKQNQTMLQWKKDAWRDMNKSLFDFYDKQLSKLRLESTFNKKNISVSNSKDVEVKPGSTLPEGTHTIDYIEKLAESAKVSTDKLQHKDPNVKVTKDTKLSELVIVGKDENGKEVREPILKEGEKIKIKVSDSVDKAGNPIYKEVELSGDMKVGQMQSTLQSAMPNTNVSFDESIGAFFISGKKTGASQFIKITAAEPGAQNKAFQLLGIKGGNGSTAVETVSGTIQYEMTVGLAKDTTLSKLGLTKDVLAKGNTLQLTVAGTPLTIELTEDMTLEGIATKVNEAISKDSALNGQVSVQYDTATGAFKAKKADGTDAAISLDDIVKVEDKGPVKNEGAIEKLTKDGVLTTKVTKTATGDTKLGQIGFFKEGDPATKKFEIKIGNQIVSIDVTADTDIKTVVAEMQKKISENADIADKPIFSFDEKNGKFLIGKGIEVLGDEKDLERLGIQKSQSVFTAEGSNAKLSYNGIVVESETNNISVNGFNFSIKGTTNEAITVVSTFDVDAVVDVVKNFVDEYNKLIKDIHGKLDSPGAKGYKPLTDEQKKDMSEYEIEQWEKKIKDNLFKGDKDLEKTVSDMRQLLGGSVAGNAFGTLSAIGISTGDWKENGKLHFDEEKFRKAIGEDSDGVIQLLAGGGDPAGVYLEENPGKTMDDYNKLGASDKAKYENKTKGFMDRMYDHITTVTKSSELKSAYSFYNDKLHTKKMSEQAEEVKKLEERMYRMEDMYYKKFTAMEKMMSQLNNQSNWLMSQMGGM